MSEENTDIKKLAEVSLSKCVHFYSYGNFREAEKYRHILDVMVDLGIIVGYDRLTKQITYKY